MLPSSCRPWLGLVGPSRLSRRSKRQQGLEPEGTAVAEACGQCVAQDDALSQGGSNIPGLPKVKHVERW